MILRRLQLSAFQLIPLTLTLTRVLIIALLLLLLYRTLSILQSLQHDAESSVEEQQHRGNQNDMTEHSTQPDHFALGGRLHAVRICKTCQAKELQKVMELQLMNNLQ